jgi:hypothetical protein
MFRLTQEGLWTAPQAFRNRSAKYCDKEKGPLDTERPKSREETPKEGCEARARLTYRTAKTKGAPHHKQMRIMQG